MVLGGRESLEGLGAIVCDLYFLFIQTSLE